MNDKTKEFRSGFITILGRPNAGKSTLLNALVGQKIAIVSNKPQTTRDRIAGILTTDTYQMILVDTPGVIEPTDRFNETLMYRVGQALEHIDVIYHLVDATQLSSTEEAAVAQLVKSVRCRARFLLLNKVDQLSGQQDELVGQPDAQAYDKVLRISALKGLGLPDLLERTAARLPTGPAYYGADQMTDRDERFLSTEIVREKVFHHLGAEIPYSVYTDIEAFEERENKDYIRITIYVERDSQKGIVIGAGGSMLKKIGQEARHDIEEITGRPAYLELWVKVRKNWRKSESDLSNFGFKKSSQK